jgi:uncharacterized delta-60 repeat protein
MKKQYLLLLFFALTVSNAQNPTDLDPSFDSKDYLPNLTLFSKNFTLQPDGKVIVIGNSCLSKFYKDELIIEKNHILRLNENLSIDDTFKSGVGFDSSPFGVATQPDGKILVGGGFTTYNGNSVQKIIRLNGDGTLDNTFNIKNNGFSNFTFNYVHGINLLSDGKIMICGKFNASKYSSFRGINLVRLNSNGTIDETFQPGYGGQNGMFKFEIQPDNKIVRVYLTTIGTTDTYRIDRLNPNGDIDSTFNPIEGFQSICSSGTVDYDGMFDCKLAIQNDGKILFGACFNKFNYIDTSGLMRFNSDGTKDTSFNYSVPGYPMVTAKDFIILPNNKILKHNLSLIETDGKSSDLPIIKLDANTRSIKVLQCSNDKLIVCTENEVSPTPGTLTRHYKFIKLDLTTQKTNIQSQASTFYEGNDVIQKSNGDIILLGNSRNNFNTKYHDGIKLLDKNGVIKYNSSFYENLYNQNQNNNNSFRKGLVQPDDKIVVLQHTYGTKQSLIRFNNDYTIDTSFSCDIVGSLSILNLQKDGKIIFGSNQHNDINRINSDGSIDNSFIPNSSLQNGVDGKVYCVAIQKDNKILVGGEFTSYNGFATKNILRLNNDGSIDKTFQSDKTLSGYISSIAVQSDGKIIIGGDSLSYISGAYVDLRRLKDNGEIDNTFNSYDTKIDHGITNIYIEPNDKILLVSKKNYQYSNDNNSEFKRLESNGTVDPTFDIGDGFNGNINSIFKQIDGSFIITGGFTKYKNEWCNGTVRLIGEKTNLSTLSFTYYNQKIVLYPNPVKDILNITLKENIQINSVQIYNTLGELVINQSDKNGISTINVSNLNKGVYSIILNSNKKLSSKFIKL